MSYDRMYNRHAYESKFRFADFSIDAHVFRVSAHECLNITHDFGLHGRLPGV